MAEYVYIQDYSKRGKLGISKKSIEHIVERHKISYERAFDLKMNYVYNPSKWIWEKKGAC